MFKLLAYSPSKRRFKTLHNQHLSPKNTETPCLKILNVEDVNSDDDEDDEYSDSSEWKGIPDDNELTNYHEIEETIESRPHSLANASQTREKTPIDKSSYIDPKSSLNPSADKPPLDPHTYQNPLELDEELQVILSDMDRKIGMAETRKKAEDHRDRLLEELYHRHQLSDGDARYEYMKLRQYYMFIFDDEENDWYYLKRVIEELNEEMKNAQGVEKQLIIKDKILEELDNQARNARRLEEGERLNFMQDRFLNAELGTQFELLSSYNEALQDFRSDYDNETENKNDGE